jgi:hypothetical protein
MKAQVHIAGDLEKRLQKAARQEETQSQKSDGSTRNPALPLSAPRLPEACR